MPAVLVRGDHFRFGSVFIKKKQVFCMDEREPATFWASLKPEVNQKMNSTPFQAAIENFYMTDSITRASKIMAQCSSLLLKK
uniref:NADH-ubiquinone oxidoreductase 75 kDa subunit mitochondrial-like domain-containing protein n=1 Tax=Populus trichocarpa TaxID=3694 RepID=A0A2K1X7K8_POPTR